MKEAVREAFILYLSSVVCSSRTRNIATWSPLLAYKTVRRDTYIMLSILLVEGSPNMSSTHCFLLRYYHKIFIDQLTSSKNKLRLESEVPFIWNGSCGKKFRTLKFSSLIIFSDFTPTEKHGHSYRLSLL